MKKQVKRREASKRRKSAGKTRSAPARSTGSRAAASPRSRPRALEPLSRTYTRPRTGGLANVPKSEVGTTIQDFIDYDDARVVTATSRDGLVFDVVHVR